MADALAHGPYAEFALLLIISAVAGAVAVRLRQPVLIAYIVVGILVGPAVFGIVKAHDQVALLAEIGVTVLLFVVGLKLHTSRLGAMAPRVRSAGRVLRLVLAARGADPGDADLAPEDR